MMYKDAALEACSGTKGPPGTFPWATSGVGESSPCVHSGTADETCFEKIPRLLGALGCATRRSAITVAKSAEESWQKLGPGEWPGRRRTANGKETAATATNAGRDPNREPKQPP